MRKYVAGLVCVAFLLVGVAVPARAVDPQTPTPFWTGYGDPAIYWMFASYQARCIDSYMGWMTDDFSFDSDDPAFRAAFPGGMNKQEMRASVTHLFFGGGHGADGRPLPAVEDIQETRGPLRTAALEADTVSERLVVIEFGFRLVFPTGSYADMGATANTFEMVRYGDGIWQVRRWHEAHGAVPLDSIASPEAGGRASPSAGRIAIGVQTGHAGGTLVFNLRLPGSGGELEIFDEMGRRMARRELTSVRPGTQTFSVAGESLRPGVYWARVRQDGTSASTKFVWIP